MRREAFIGGEHEGQWGREKLWTWRLKVRAGSAMRGRPWSNSGALGRNESLNRGRREGHSHSEPARSVRKPLHPGGQEVHRVSADMEDRRLGEAEEEFEDLKSRRLGDTPQPCQTLLCK